MMVKGRASARCDERKREEKREVRPDEVRWRLSLVGEGSSSAVTRE